MAPGAGAGAIELDEEDGIVRVSNGVLRGEGLRVAVDRDLLDNNREPNTVGADIGANVDGPHARARNVKVNGVINSEISWVLRHDIRIAEGGSRIHRGDGFAERHRAIIRGKVITGRRDGDGSGRRGLGPQQEQQPNHAARSSGEMAHGRSARPRFRVFRYKCFHGSDPLYDD